MASTLSLLRFSTYLSPTLKPHSKPYSSLSSCRAAPPDAGDSPPSPPPEQRNRRKKRERDVRRREPIDIGVSKKEKEKKEKEKEESMSENEGAFVVTWLGLGFVILVEGLTLAASGFLPDEWDKFLVKYLYPAFTPTVFLFVGGSVAYGVIKYLEAEKMKNN